jgi:Rps23 Pro-64 3,4-dihydroxylase Tpa1-like proline 4-hydroxylase
MNNKELKKIAIESCKKIDRNNSDFEYSDKPFRHFIVDNFLPKDLVEGCLKNFPEKDDEIWEVTNDKDIEIKQRTQWQSEFDIPEHISDVVRVLNSSIFLQSMSSVIGIYKLITDPYYTGGGLNVSFSSGLLDVHVDGNYHDATGLNRRLNALLYLNHSWQDNWGGHLGFYDETGDKCIKKILPIFNRLVVFDTSDISFHGLPEPIKCPKEVSRKSIVLYYYTKEERPKNQVKYKKPHSALWKKKSIKDKKGGTDREYL